ncbi:DUF3103 family protein, partial [Streptomyces thermocarboxydus]
MRPRHLRRRGALAAAAATLAVLCAGQTLAAPQAAAAPPWRPREARTSTASEVHTAQDAAAHGDHARPHRPRLARPRPPGRPDLRRGRRHGPRRRRPPDHPRRGRPPDRRRQGPRPGRRPPAPAAARRPFDARRAHRRDGTLGGRRHLGRRPRHRVRQRQAGPTRSTPEGPARPCTSSTSTAPAPWPAGLDVLHEELARQGVRSADPAAPRPAQTRLGRRRGFWTTRITAVSLSDDQEPWIKGDAEIYTLVTGFGHDGKVQSIRWTCRTRQRGHRLPAPADPGQLVVVQVQPGRRRD